MSERCFYCGMPMVDGVCPDCGYYYPFAFECPYKKGITCSIKKIPCNKGEKFGQCEIWKQASYSE